MKLEKNVKSVLVGSHLRLRSLPLLGKVRTWQQYGLWRAEIPQAGETMRGDGPMTRRDCGLMQCRVASGVAVWGVGERVGEDMGRHGALGNPSFYAYCPKPPRIFSVHANTKTPWSQTYGVWVPFGPPGRAGRASPGDTAGATHDEMEQPVFDTVSGQSGRLASYASEMRVSFRRF